MFREALLERLAGRLELTGKQVEVLAAHYELLVLWNRRLNLTSPAALEEAVERHYCESLFLGAQLPAGAQRIVDIGSGAGFPGTSVAVLRPDCAVTLVESHQRKAVFLRESTRGLRNVKVWAGRAEAVTGEFDWAVSRAVSYGDLAPSVRRLASRCALLAGAEAPTADFGFEWEAEIQLPWGDRRFLRLGKRLASFT